MCIELKTIVNPTKFVPRNFRYPYLIQVPCGHCVECAALKKLEYQFRIFHEMDRCFSSGGYVMFDTLTYDEDSVPMVSDVLPSMYDDDFHRFSRRDIQLWLKRLRKNLSDVGFDVKDKLRYFISSEYGTTPGLTHRPHYHVLLFVNVLGLKPLYLSREIDYAWSKGRTDGINYHSASYVNNHNVLYRHSLKLDNYVSKYVNKDSVFQSAINIRFNYAWEQIKLDHKCKSDPFGDLWANTPKARSMKLRLWHLIDQFHRQSRGFGLSGLKSVNMELLFKHGLLQVPDGDKAVVNVPLFQYYKRKLFYELSEFDGQKFWVVNPLGREYLKVRQAAAMILLNNRISTVLLNYPTSSFADRMRNVDRNLFVDFIVNYRGRVKAYQSYDNSFIHDDFDSLYFSYVTPRDQMRFGGRFVSDRYLGNMNGYRKVPRNVNVMSLKWFIDRHVINQDNFDCRFRGFDDLYSDFVMLQRALALPKQELSDHLQRLSGVVFVR